MCNKESYKGWAMPIQCILMLTYANLETGSNNVVALPRQVKNLHCCDHPNNQGNARGKNDQILIDETLKCKNSAKSCKIIGVNTKNAGMVG